PHWSISCAMPCGGRICLGRIMVTVASPHPVLARVTERVIERSRATREAFMARTDRYKSDEPRRKKLSCANYAHVVAASPMDDKLAAALDAVPNIGIITAYNDMLSAHQPYHDYPEKLRGFARKVGATTQVAGG